MLSSCHWIVWRGSVLLIFKRDVKRGDVVFLTAIFEETVCLDETMWFSMKGESLKFSIFLDNKFN